MQKYPKGHFKNPWSMKDAITDDPEDVIDELTRNGMFRNRSPDLAKPISGSNADMPDENYHGELAEYNRAMLEWEREDQETSMKEAFPEEY